MSGRRLSYAAVSVLHAIADGVRYGFDVMDRTELPSGTVYPALSRLERDGYVKSHWEDPVQGARRSPSAAPLLPHHRAGRARAGRVARAVPRPQARAAGARAPGGARQGLTPERTPCWFCPASSSPSARRSCRRQFRDDWTREWEAELWHHSERLRRGAPLSVRRPTGSRPAIGRRRRARRSGCAKKNGACP